jgi:hypothetical protein
MSGTGMIGNGLFGGGMFGSGTPGSDIGGIWMGTAASPGSADVGCPCSTMLTNAAVIASAARR